MYGFTVLGSSGSLLIRLNAAATQLADSELQLITLDDYRERLVELKLAGNQEQDSQEVATSGRKFMIWSIPRSLTNNQLEALAREFFEDEFEASAVTISARCHPYAWIILVHSTLKQQQMAADFEAVLQAKWGLEINLALSKTRQQRIRMHGTNRDRIEQRESLSRPAGVLKEIMIPAKVIQDAIMEPAFLDMWIDAVYSRMGPRLVTDIVAAVEQRVEELVAARVEAALQIKMVEFSTQVLQKIYNTIDSAVDVSITRALEARVMAQDNEEDDFEDFQHLLDRVPRPEPPPPGVYEEAPAAAPVSPAKAAKVLISPVSPLDIGGPQETTKQMDGDPAPIEEDTVSKKRTQDVLQEMAEGAAEDAAPKVIRELSGSTRFRPTATAPASPVPTNTTAPTPESMRAPTGSAQRPSKENAGIRAWLQPASATEGGSTPE